MNAMPVDGVWPVVAVPLIAALAYATRAMSLRGAVGGAVIGTGISLGAGWAGFAMLAALLAVGTVVSRSSSRGRGALQALCNGAAATACSLAAGFGATWGLAAVAGALATALGDTVAGELGQRFDRRPRMLLFGHVAAPGADGAMSWAGTLSGLGASLLVVVVGSLCGAPWEARAVVAIALAGLAGNLIDSLLGAFLQPHLGRNGNDWVNLLATSAGAALAAVSTL